MINKNDTELMKNAYGLIYEVENSLRSYIKAEMSRTYGVHWYFYADTKVMKRRPKKSTFEQLEFPEYETYFRNYSNVFGNVPPVFFSLLHSLYPIRNKIAHNHLLSDKELTELDDSASFLIEYMQSHMSGMIVSE